MRRMWAILLVMLGVCATSFGNYFLIYNVSTTMKGVDFNTDQKVSVPLKGYLILDIDDSNDAVQDVNFVMYGKDANMPKNPVYVQFNSLQSSDRNYLNWGMDNSGSYVFYDFWIPYGESNTFCFRWFVMGKKSTKNVGLIPGERDIAGSMKGTLIVWYGMLLDNDLDMEGTSNVSVTLNNSYTKMFNSTGTTWTKDQVLNGQLIGGVTRGIKPDLARKHYTDVTP
jgi:hypothetical protein